MACPLIRCGWSALHVGVQLLSAVFLFETTASAEIGDKTLWRADYGCGFAITLARIAAASAGSEFPVQAM